MRIPARRVVCLDFDCISEMISGSKSQSLHTHDDAPAEVLVIDVDCRIDEQVSA